MRIYSSLAIFSTKLSPHFITTTIGLKPNKTWQVGDVRKYRVNPAEDNGCVFDSNLDVKKDMDEHVTYIMEQFIEKIEALKTISKAAEINTVFSIYSTESPPTVFDKDFIKFLGDINSSLDIDLYYFD